MKRMTATDIMETSVFTLAPDTNIHEATQLLLKKRLSGAAVVDDGRVLRGMLSEKDCLKVMAAEAFEQLPEGHVRDYMSDDLVTVSETSTLYEIVNLFLANHFRRIPVVSEQGVLLGVVSRGNALKAVSTMRDNPTLYGTPDKYLPEEESPGVDSAMKRARGQ